MKRIMKRGVLVSEYEEIFLDNKYQIMSEIAENENISQRELSKKLGISLGSVNVLINKMIKEGLIKIEHVSQKQVLYMLTPTGIMEKAKKTVSYLKIHYKAIYETKEKIKSILSGLEEYNTILILLSEDEMGEIIKVATDEYILHNKKNIIYIESIDCIDLKKCINSVVIYISNEDIGEKYLDKDLAFFNIIDIL